MTFGNSIASQPTTLAQNLAGECRAYLFVAITSAGHVTVTSMIAVRGVHNSPCRDVVAALSMVLCGVDVNRSANSHCF